MLYAEPTSRLAGVIFWGDAWDLHETRECVSRLTDENNPYVRKAQEFVLGPSYDLRKALEGQRRKKTIIYAGTDTKTIYGVEVIWVYALAQIAMLRTAAAFERTTTKDQAILFSLESALEDALRSGFPRDAEHILETWQRLRGSEVSRPAYDCDSRASYFVSLPSTTERRESLLPVLWSLLFSYDMHYNAHQRGMPDPRMIAPEEFRRYSNADLPAFDW